MSIVKREVTVQIGPEDKPTKLVFRLGINEMIATQADWGIKDDQEFLDQIDKPQSLARFRALVRNALLIHQPDMTEIRAGDVITELGMPRMKAIIAETTSWAFPEPEPPKAAEPGKVDAASPGVMPS